MKLSVYQECCSEEKEVEIEFQLEKDGDGDIVLYARNKNNNIRDSILYIDHSTGKINLLHISPFIKLPRNEKYFIELE